MKSLFAAALLFVATLAQAQSQEPQWNQITRSTDGRTTLFVHSQSGTVDRTPSGSVYFTARFRWLTDGQNRHSVIAVTEVECRQTFGFAVEFDMSGRQIGRFDFAFPGNTMIGAAAEELCAWGLRQLDNAPRQNRPKPPASSWDENQNRPNNGRI